MSYRPADGFDENRRGTEFERIELAVVDGGGGYLALSFFELWESGHWGRGVIWHPFLIYNRLESFLSLRYDASTLFCGYIDGHLELGKLLFLRRIPGEPYSLLLVHMNSCKMVMIGGLELTSRPTE